MFSVLGCSLKHKHAHDLGLGGGIQKSVAGGPVLGFFFGSQFGSQGVSPHSGGTACRPYFGASFSDPKREHNWVAAPGWKIFVSGGLPAGIVGFQQSSSKLLGWYMYVYRYLYWC